MVPQLSVAYLYQQSICWITANCSELSIGISCIMYGKLYCTVGWHSTQAKLETADLNRAENITASSRVLRRLGYEMVYLSQSRRYTLSYPREYL